MCWYWNAIGSSPAPTAIALRLNVAALIIRKFSGRAWSNSSVSISSDPAQEQATQLVAPSSKSIEDPPKELPMKNLFAAIGLIVVLKKGYELYCEYNELKREKEARQSPSM
jgi:hypothetical protein